MAIFAKLNHYSYGLTTHHSSRGPRHYWRGHLHQQKEESVTDADLGTALDGYLLSCHEERAAALSGKNLHFVTVHFNMYHTVRRGNIAL